jgi:hypothetical protein
MLTITLQMNLVKGAHTHERWFFDRPLAADAVRVVYYYNCKSRDEFAGFRRRAKFTQLIDVEKSDEELLADLGASTRNEVRRAAKDGVSMEVGASPEEFIAFYDQFAVGKGLPRLSAKEINSYWPHLLVTKAVFEGEILVMHSSLLDIEGKRGASLHSASVFRNLEDSTKRRVVGRANRFLHYQDFMKCRDRGMRIYDMGGCSPNTTDVELARITEFKQSFGGELVEESNYASALAGLAQRAKRMLRG